MPRRRWHSVRRNGPGRMRIRIAKMLKDNLGISVDAYDIFCNNSPSDRHLDMCRWGVDGTLNGTFVHVCSWDRMGDIIKAGCLAVVEDNPYHYEVCRGSKKPPTQES